MSHISVLFTNLISLSIFPLHSLSIPHLYSIIFFNYYYNNVSQTSWKTNQILGGKEVSQKITDGKRYLANKNQAQQAESSSSVAKGK